VFTSQPVYINCCESRISLGCLRVSHKSGIILCVVIHCNVPNVVFVLCQCIVVLATGACHYSSLIALHFSGSSSSWQKQLRTLKRILLNTYFILLHVHCGTLRHATNRSVIITHDTPFLSITTARLPINIH